MSMMKKLLTTIVLLALGWQVISAQCKVQNTFFQNGEKLTYDMYFKLGFLSTHAGKLELSVEEGSINGKGDHKITFQTNTSGMVDGVYAVHDTLYAYVTKDIVPVAYFKNAMESSDYTQEELYYDYKKSDGHIDIHTKRHKNGEFRFDEKLTSDTCIYDMVSVVYYARTLDFDSMKKNDKVAINFISGLKKSHVDIEYKGTKKVKANDGSKYECVELVLNFTAGGGSSRSKEMMKVYVTNDANRIPIEINTNLKKVGAIRGLLKEKEGLRN